MLPHKVQQLAPRGPSTKHKASGGDDLATTQTLDRGPRFRRWRSIRTDSRGRQESHRAVRLGRSRWKSGTPAKLRLLISRPSYGANGRLLEPLHNLCSIYECHLNATILGSRSKGHVTIQHCRPRVRLSDKNNSTLPYSTVDRVSCYPIRIIARYHTAL